ncbi:MAG TPA: hypothetical protein VD766_05205 [Solirubrobacterales bacterium]|nr:hypothetical protein [Solirubrobacterales bacterium]
MPSTPFLIRYPGGDAELYWGTEAPSVGDTIRRRDGDWIVSRVEASLEGPVNVTVRPSAVERDDGWPTSNEPAAAPRAWITPSD